MVGTTVGQERVADYYCLKKILLVGFGYDEAPTSAGMEVLPLLVRLITRFWVIPQIYPKIRTKNKIKGVGVKVEILDVFEISIVPLL